MTKTEDIQLSMMVVGVGQAVGYDDKQEALRIVKILMDWVSTPEQRGEIYSGYRNETGPRNGLESS